MMLDELILALQSSVDESESHVILRKEDAVSILEALKSVDRLQRHLHETMVESMVAGKALEMATTGTENGYVGDPSGDVPHEMWGSLRDIDSNLSNALRDDTARKVMTWYFVRWLKAAIREQGVTTDH